MARLYLDNDVSLRIAPLLRQRRHDVVAARDLTLNRATDDAQLLTAVQNGRILVTYNRRDFTMLHDAWQTWPAAFGLALPKHPGILVLDHASLDTQFEAIATLLAMASTETLTNEIFWWDRHDGWRRREVGSGWKPYA